MTVRCPDCGSGIEVAGAASDGGVPRALQVGRLLAGGAPGHAAPACPACGATSYARTDARMEKAYLLSRADALSLDAARAANLYLRLCDDAYERFVAPVERDGRVPVRSVARRVWDVLDRRRRRAVKEEDWDVAAKLCLAKARYRCGMGLTSDAYHRDAMRYQLLHLQAQGAQHVRIAVARDGMVCPRCAELTGRVLTVAEALEQMPLPVTCDEAGRRVQTADGRAWCRCFYVRQA